MTKQSFSCPHSKLSRYRSGIGIHGGSIFSPPLDAEFSISFHLSSQETTRALLQSFQSSGGLSEARRGRVCLPIVSAGYRKTEQNPKEIGSDVLALKRHSEAWVNIWKVNVVLEAGLWWLHLSPTEAKSVSMQEQWTHIEPDPWKNISWIWRPDLDLSL